MSLRPCRRLNRRTGQSNSTLPAQPLIQDTQSISLEQQLCAREEDRIKELYESTRGRSFEPRPSCKRAKNDNGVVEMEDTQLSSATMSASERSKASSEAMQMDQREENKGENDDLFAQTLKRTRRTTPMAGLSATQTSVFKHSKTDSKLMPPPLQKLDTQPLSHGRTIQIPIDSALRCSKKKDDNGLKPTTKDEAFLRAITERIKTKSAIDKLDADFEKSLRIPKRQTATETERPDYTVLDDFDDNLRGNFIEVIRRDLFRKDLRQRKPTQVYDDGKPNFKKFKKKEITRRPPLSMILTASAVQNTILQPGSYWPTQTSQKQNQGPIVEDEEEEEDDLPLLPKTNKRRLLEYKNDDDDVSVMCSARTMGTATRELAEVQATSGLQKAACNNQNGQEDTIFSMGSQMPPINLKTNGNNASLQVNKTTNRRRKKLVNDENEDTIHSNFLIPTLSKSTRIVEGRDVDTSIEPFGTATLDNCSRSTTGRNSTQKRKALVVNVDDDEGGFGGFKRRRKPC
ncbi:hypothetical protein L204_103712 [Cryptococcus depauperatus]